MPSMTDGHRFRIVPETVLKIGQTVFITAGPLAGWCGILTQRHPHSWTVATKCLPVGMYVVLPDEFLEPGGWESG